MRTQINKTNYLHIRITKELKDEYIKLCKEKRYSISTEIRTFIINQLNNEKNNK